MKLRCASPWSALGPLLKMQEQRDYIKSCPQKFIAHNPPPILPTKKIRSQNKGNLLPKAHGVFFSIS